MIFVTRKYNSLYYLRLNMYFFVALKVEEARNKCVEDHGAGVRAKHAKNDNPDKNKAKKNGKTPARKSKKDESSSDDDEDEDEGDEEEEEKENNKKKLPTRRSDRMTKSSKKKVIGKIHFYLIIFNQTYYEFVNP